MSEPAMPSSFYKVGGALPQDMPSYVKRQTDDTLFVALQTREFCYVLNSRQMGKTSLMVRTLTRLKAEGWAGIIIDFSAKDSQADQPDRWYDGIINQINRQFGLLDRKTFLTWLKERDFIAPVERLSEFIETVLLPSSAQSIVIFIDEIDSTLGLPFTDDFFALIRSCYNKRSENADYGRLTFALLGVAAPSELIGDAKRTPFNIGESIDLKGFTPQEALSLANGLTDKADRPQVVLQEILHWTGGQPFLTQRLCQLVADSNFPITSGAETSQVQRLVESRIIQNWESQDHQAHLKTIRKRLLDDEQKAGYLLELYRQIRQSEELPASNQPEERELQLSGLVVKRDNHLRVYNPIYAAVFDDGWIDAELGKLRPYAESYRAWSTSGKTDASRLLRGSALIEAEQWATEKATLSAEDREFLAASRAQQREEEISAKEREAELARERTARETAEAAEQVQAEANRLAQRKIQRGGVFLGGALAISAVLGGLSIFSGNRLRVAQYQTDEARQELEQTQQELLKMDKQSKKFTKELTQSRNDLQRVKDERQEAEGQLEVADKQVIQARRELQSAQKSQQEAEAAVRSAQTTTEEAIRAKEDAQELVKQAQVQLERAEQELISVTQELATLTQQQEEISEVIVAVNQLSSLIDALYEKGESNNATDAIEQLGLSFTDLTEGNNDLKKALLKSSIALAYLHLEKKNEAAIEINKSIQLIHENKSYFNSSNHGRMIAFFSHAIKAILLEEENPTIFPERTHKDAFSYVTNKNIDIQKDNILDHYHGLMSSSLGYQNWHVGRTLTRALLKRQYDFRAEKLIREIDNLLMKKEWNKADLLTWEVIVFMSLAENPYEFTFTNVSCPDLKKIDAVWAENSQVNGESYFGFKVQKEIFQEGRREISGNHNLGFAKFFSELGWLASLSPIQLEGRDDVIRYAVKKYDELKWDTLSPLKNRNLGYLPASPWLYGYISVIHHSQLKPYTVIDPEVMDIIIHESDNFISIDMDYPKQEIILQDEQAASVDYDFPGSSSSVSYYDKNGIMTTSGGGSYYQGNDSLDYRFDFDRSRIFECDY